MVDIWKKNILADLDLGDWTFLLVGDLLVVFKREFGKGDDNLAKVAELKEVKQGFLDYKWIFSDILMSSKG